MTILIFFLVASIIGNLALYWGARKGRPFFVPSEYILKSKLEDYTAKHDLTVKDYEARISKLIGDIERRIEETAKIKFDAWKVTESKKIRADAIKGSVSTINGKVLENVSPYLPDFKWNPRDCRFLGSPIDFIVFDGLSDYKDEVTVIFVEVKSGKSNLTKREREIKKAIIDKRVVWELYRIP